MALDSGTATAATNSTYLIDPMDSTGTTLADGWFAGYYKSVSQREHIYGSPMIHLADLAVPDVPAPDSMYQLRLRTDDGSYVRTVEYHTANKGLLANLHQSGTFAIEAVTYPSGTSLGYLCQGDTGDSKFVVGNDEQLFSQVMFCSEETDRSSSGMSGGKVAGIAVGTILAVAAVAALVVWLVVFGGVGVITGAIARIRGSEAAKDGAIAEELDVASVGDGSYTDATL